MKIISCILAFLILLIGLTFACLNAESVTINYYIGVSQLPLSLLLVLVFSLGSLLGLLFSACVYIKQKRQQLRLKQQIKTAKQEILNLRNMQEDTD